MLQVFTDAKLEVTVTASVTITDYRSENHQLDVLDIAVSPLSGIGFLTFIFPSSSFMFLTFL